MRQGRGFVIVLVDDGAQSPPRRQKCSGRPKSDLAIWNEADGMDVLSVGDEPRERQCASVEKVIVDPLVVSANVWESGHYLWVRVRQQEVDVLENRLLRADGGSRAGNCSIANPRQPWRSKNVLHPHRITIALLDGSPPVFEETQQFTRRRSREGVSLEEDIGNIRKKNSIIGSVTAA